MKKTKVLLCDIDGVICDFTQGVIDRAKEMGLEAEFPADSSQVTCWNMCDKFSMVMRDMWRNEDFWLNLKPIAGSQPLPFIPTAYITSRPISGTITKRWLDTNGYPEAMVITVAHPSEKIKYALELNADIVVDDLYYTIREMQEVGITGLLLKAPHQRSHQKECEGLTMIESLREVLQYV